MKVRHILYSLCIVLVIAMFFWLPINKGIADKIDDDFKYCHFDENRSDEVCTNELTGLTIFPVYLSSTTGEIALWTIEGALSEVHKSEVSIIVIFWKTFYVQSKNGEWQTFKFPLELQNGDNGIQEVKLVEGIDPRLTEESIAMGQAETVDLDVSTENTSAPTAIEIPTARECSTDEIQIQIGQGTVFPEEGKLLRDNFNNYYPQAGGEWFIKNISNCAIRITEFMLVQEDGRTYEPLVRRTNGEIMRERAWLSEEVLSLTVTVDPRFNIYQEENWSFTDTLIIKTEFNSIQVGQIIMDTPPWFYIVEEPGTRDTSNETVFQVATVTISSDSFKIETELTKDLEGNSTLLIEKACDQEVSVVVNSTELVQINGHWTDSGWNQTTLRRSKDYTDCGSLLLQVGEAATANSMMEVDGLSISITNQTHFNIQAIGQESILFNFPLFRNLNTYEDSWIGPFEIKNGEFVDFYLFK